MHLNSSKLKSAAILGLLLCSSFGVVCSGPAQNSATPQTPGSATRQMLQGHVPAIVNRLAPMDRLPAASHMRLAIGLPLRNREALANLLQQISDPASTNYHHYLTPEQFAASFGPTEQDYEAVISFAMANGLTVTRTHPNRTLLDVDGAVADIEKAFQVTLRVYQHPTENRTFFAPDIEPSVPSAVRVLDISGLNNFVLPHPKNLKLRPPNLSPKATPRAGSAPTGDYLGYDFRKAYVPNTTLTGAGQVVGLLQFDGYDTNDILAYEQLAGLPNVPLQNVLLDGFDGTPSGNGGEVEVSLDIEMSISMAPGLAKVVVYEAGPFGFPNDLLSEMATPTHGEPLPMQLSCSWGWGGGPSATTDQYFQQMIVQGQSFFDASGDVDAFPPGAVDDPFTFNAPSDDPYITQVGGTILTTTGPGGSWVSETVWNVADGVGSSGGISSYYPIATTAPWQLGVNMTANHGSTTFRNLPDVALTADNVYVIADSGIAYAGVGGTSCAAPLWAGFTALVNQQTTALGNPPVGFLNPALYAIGKGASYGATFHDIATGNNAWSGSPTAFYAVSGYDLCTGWGSPAGQSLIDALSASGCLPDGILEVGVTPANGSTLIQATTETIYVRVTDARPVTNATVVATVNGGTNLVFKNNGVAPDSIANDEIYTANLGVAANANSVTLTFLITAPGKVNSTNIVVYNVVPVPGNNSFTNAIKVPTAGAVYLSNNKLATMEPGEPLHDGIFTVAASLWWKWTPTADTNVLIDVYGSAINAALAVYTGSTLTSLQPVTPIESNVSGNAAYIRFSAKSNTTYQIAVASSSPTSEGSIRFQVAPGLLPDTNAPEVFVASPLSGLGVTNSLITFSGTASDPQPNASGVSQVFLVLNDQCTLVAQGTTNWSLQFGLRPGVNNIKAYAQDFAGNISAPVSIVVVYFVEAPANDFFVNAIALASPGRATVDSSAATKELGEPDHAGNVGGKSVWYTYQPPSDGVLHLSTANSTFDTLLGLYTGSSVANLTTIANNDDAFLGVPGGFSQIDQAVRSNLNYAIAVDGYDGVSGTVVLTNWFAPATVYRLTTSSSAGGSVQVTTLNSRGGTAVMPGTSGDFANNTSVVLTAMPNPYYQFNIWNGSLIGLDNPLTIIVTSNMNLTAGFSPIIFTDGFESGDLQHIGWTTAGNKPWIVQTNVFAAGRFAAMSGAIGNSQSSSLILSANFRAGVASFDYRVSSEEFFDVLGFYVDGVLLQQWSGEVGWATFSFPLSATNHTLEWRYTKDATLSGGHDAAFIDNVNLPLVIVPDGAAPAHLSLERQTDPAFFVNLFGQTNQRYILQVSSNLVDWVNLSTNVATGGFLRIADPASETNAVRFYRAIAVP